MSFDDLLRGPYPLIGVLHLPPLPGAPRPGPPFAELLTHALRDAEALAEGGAPALIVENLGDAPFGAGAVEPHVVGMLAVIAREVRQRFPQLVVGVNALRNDALGALGAAAAADAAFVRVNVHTGAMVTDQGLITGQARETLLYRRRVCPAVGIAADVLVKHATPLGEPQLEQAAQDTFRRGGAQVLIVSGSGTGQPTDPERLRRVREAVPEAPVWVGSGATLATARALAQVSTGAIVGTALHHGGQLSAPLDPARVRALVEALREAAPGR